MQKIRNKFDYSSLKYNQYIELVVFDPEHGKINLWSRLARVEGDYLVLKWPIDSFGVRYFFKKVSFVILQAIGKKEIISFKASLEREKVRNYEEGELMIKPPLYFDGLSQQRSYERVSKQTDITFSVQRCPLGSRLMFTAWFQINLLFRWLHFA